jgi:HlyD family secretion protein
MKFSRSWAYVAAALLIGALALVAVSRRGKPVEVVMVSQGKMVQSVVTSGRVADTSRVEITSQNTARIEHILVREGDVVQPGQVLVQLRDDEAQATARQTQAAVQEAQMRLRQIQTVQGPVSDQQLAQARAANTLAQNEMLRNQDLVKQGFVSQSRLDDVRRAALVSEAALRSAKAQAEGNQTGGVEMALAQARLEQAQAAHRAALARLDSLSLRAPAVLKVISRANDPGDTAQAGKSILTLVGGGEVRIQASVDEKNLKFLRLDQIANATADAYADRHFTARLSYIAPAVDSQRGTVDLRLRVEPAVDYLRPDMTVSVEIITAEATSALLLPTEALRRDASGALYVLVNQDGHAKQVSVAAGLQGTGTTQITQGLAQGDHVILPGTLTADGDRVREQAATKPRGNMPQVPGLTN